MTNITCLATMGDISIALLICFLYLGVASAEDIIVSNSANGMDVISTISYANCKNIEFRFLNSLKSADDVVAKVGTGRDVLLIQSTDNPYTRTLATSLESKGNSVMVVESKDPIDTNYLLARRSDTKRFIVVDTTYGYNALCVIPYAAINDAFVLLADADNAGDLRSFLDSVKPEWVMQYGYLDESVVKILSGFNQQKAINSGDKYLDSIEIVKRYLDKSGGRQVVLMDGSFLEYGVAKGEDPILLVSSIIPDSVHEYLLNSGIKTLVLIGADLVAPVDNMRGRLRKEGKDLTVFVKFGQSTPSKGTDILPLDIFELPAYPLNLVVKSAAYNEANKLLEVVFWNKADAVAYVVADVQIIVNGKVVTTLGTKEPLLVGKKLEVGQTYELDLSKLNLGDAEVYVKVLAKYGATPKSLDTAAAGQFLLMKTSFEDQSRITATRLFYDRQTKRLSLEVKNTGQVDVYYLPAFSLSIGGSTKEFSAEGVLSLGAGKSKDTTFSGVDLSDEDIEKNRKVRIRISYGAREAFLIKKLDSEVPLETVKAAGDNSIFVIILLIGVVCLLFILLMRKKKRR